ncbi:MAG: hypothetical protein CSA11_01890 [Chloroflexi bacterium]|nr:MAG: hypothetical protein CSA11_01890 [Chloroflexota bacterium]
MSGETVYKAEEAAKMQGREINWPALGFIGAGLFLLAATIFDFHVIYVLWPFFVIGLGLLLMMPSYKSTKEDVSSFSFLTAPGAAITAVGVLLFAMNITGHFEAWAYAWTLVIGAFVWGVGYMKRFDPTSRDHDTVSKLMRWSLYAFVGMALFFEIVVFETFNPLFAVAFIVYGVYLLAKKRQ